MDLYISREHLITQIKTTGRHAAEARQLARRLKALLPQRLAALKQGLGPHGQRGSERRALQSQAFIDYIEEYVTIHGNSLEAKILYETSMMLYQARQSRRRYGAVAIHSN